MSLSILNSFMTEVPITWKPVRWFAKHIIDRDLRHQRVNDENLQGKEKFIFTLFSVMTLLEHNIAYWKLSAQ